METGMLKVFQAYSGRYYAYDGVTGQIFTISKDLVKENQAETEKAVCKYLMDRKQIKEGGIEKLEWDMDYHEYEKFLQGNIPKLLLQLTCRCNLNCDYCVYSGNYSHMSPHSSQEMTWETMKQAIDFYAAHNTGRGEAYIEFYGGEPLLKFQLIRNAAEYAETVFRDKPVHFGFTTNGTLLDKEVASWLDEHREFTVTVTLNGPFQDEHRKTADGRGSLSVIMENISYIRSNYQKLWENRLRFIVNIARDSDLTAIRDFYKNEVGKPPGYISHIRSQNGNDYIQNMLDDQDESQCMEEYQRMYCETQDPFFDAVFEPSIESARERWVQPDKCSGYIGGCRPISGRLYVFTDGRIGVCESVCDKLTLGNVWEGIDYPALQDLYEKTAELYNRECRNCWAQHLCTVCFKDILNPDGSLVEKISPGYCIASRNFVLGQLRMYCTIDG